ncbi:MAG: hypothetical protein IKE89_04845 [Bacilli bacterium]|nr:hypothetical protein [Bacilli bacterium]MBR2711783.1 hypothetical protein [Bacilli bacterium]
MKADMVFVNGRNFLRGEYEYLLHSFKEAFSHSSLSIERAFENVDKYRVLVESGKDDISISNTIAINKIVNNSDDDIQD